MAEYNLKKLDNLPFVQFWHFQSTFRGHSLPWHTRVLSRVLSWTEHSLHVPHFDHPGCLHTDRWTQSPFKRTCSGEQMHASKVVPSEVQAVLLFKRSWQVTKSQLLALHFLDWFPLHFGVASGSSSLQLHNKLELFPSISLHSDMNCPIKSILVSIFGSMQ